MEESVSLKEEDFLSPSSLVALLVRPLLFYHIAEVGIAFFVLVSQIEQGLNSKLGVKNLSKDIHWVSSWSPFYTCFNVRFFTWITFTRTFRLKVQIVCQA